ncbi:GNAT family N-acetyltransferase [Geosporobacter ferrireducens]|uniref:N-acetyltransferase domain-containing protein n=1 Tax=Geosporobacter ferrireducens TaxID=1424294 RepID=A0A1D8GIT5_9FIRM|nr:GNAT family N-acetyltransferase [Geosporobacter ferrireducens]AOT70811.1 hypothetical protein Gferi_15360 [Geosporobacter ferrireducens]MTI53510.1 GNAT family N-acetyltransferase [Geosporobacter ferrireducens]
MKNLVKQKRILYSMPLKERAQRVKHLLEQGILNKIEGEKRIRVPYEMMLIDAAYLNDVLALQAFVSNHLENEQTFVADSETFMREEILAPGRGRMIGVFSEGKLIAYRNISFPKPDSDYNLGRECNIPEEELGKVSILEATVVHPQYRGNRLQARLLKHTIPLLESLGYYHVFSTISPYNYPSLKNVMDTGLVIRDLKNRSGVYEGKLRFLLARDLRKPSRIDFVEQVVFSNRDIEKQQQLLQQGFIGYQLIKKAEGFDIIYGKPAE